MLLEDPALATANSLQVGYPATINTRRAFGCSAEIGGSGQYAPQRVLSFKDVPCLP